jgi:predicted DNA-binding transcriptional regulator AlpA
MVRSNSTAIKKPANTVTVKEYAKLSGMCEKTIRRWIKYGHMPSVATIKCATRYVIPIKWVCKELNKTADEIDKLIGGW